MKINKSVNTVTDLKEWLGVNRNLQFRPLGGSSAPVTDHNVAYDSFVNDHSRSTIVFFVLIIIKTSCNCSFEFVSD